MLKISLLFKKNTPVDTRRRFNVDMTTRNIARVVSMLKRRRVSAGTNFMGE